MKTSVRLIVAGDSKWPQNALLRCSGIRQLDSPGGTNITQTRHNVSLKYIAHVVSCIFLSIRNDMPFCNCDLVPIELSTV